MSKKREPDPASLDTPSCPHGITLAKFCHELHRPDQSHADTTSPTACPHGIELDTFCSNLHR